MLLENVTRVFANGDLSKSLLPAAGIQQFLGFCRQRLGASYFLTPRDTVKAFVGLLNVLEQNPGSDWRQLLTLERVPAKASEPSSGNGENESGENLAEFRL